MLEQEFNTGTLRILRTVVLAYATAAGMPESRATDVVLVVHELAANVVRHGGGMGRLSLHVAAGSLHCQVTDPGTAYASDQPVTATTASEPDPWPYQPGHGLWLVRQAADYFTAVTGPHRSQVTVAFALPSAS
jgi:anti-sigma regulatory factor (Ser/Thr protein kinase)